MIEFRSLIGEEQPLNRIWTVLLILFLCAPGAGHCMTCDECSEMDRRRSQAQVEMSRKEQDLEKALKTRHLARIAQIRGEITELRKTLLSMADKVDECAMACHPYTVQEAQCTKLKEEILALDTDDQTEASTRAKIDDLYKRLLECNNDLKKLKKPKPIPTKKPTK